MTNVISFTHGAEKRSDMNESQGCNYIWQNSLGIYWFWNLSPDMVRDGWGGEAQAKGNNHQKCARINRISFGSPWQVGKLKWLNCAYRDMHSCFLELFVRLAVHMYVWLSVHMTANSPSTPRSTCFRYNNALYNDSPILFQDLIL